jgi:hypothetical protein
MMSRTATTSCTIRFALLLALFAGTAAHAQDTRPASAPAAETQSRRKVSFWCTLWPDLLGRFDPERDEIVERVKLRNGLWYDWRLNAARTHFFVVTGQRMVVEVVDIARRAVVAEHSFMEQGFVTRVDRVLEVPGGKRWYVRVDRVKLSGDHYELEPSEWLDYDVVEKKIHKRMKELPEPIRRGARVSPDGTKWHCFGADLVIVDPVTLAEEGRIELSKPLYSGMGALRLSAGDDFFDFRDPAAYRFLYTMRDPVKKNRTVYGLVDLDMKERRVARLQEWGRNPGVSGFRVAWNRQVAAAEIGGQGGETDGNRRRRFALFDLTNGKKICEAEHELRPRRWLVAISPDGSKVYIGGAGNDLEVLDARLRPLKQVWLDADLGDRFVEVEE